MEADEEFVVTGGTEEDDEQTLEEEERLEGESDHKNEIDNLQKEGMLTALFLLWLVVFVRAICLFLRFPSLTLGFAFYGPNKRAAIKLINSDFSLVSGSCR